MALSRAARRREVVSRLTTRARAFASDPALITDAVLTLATDEALELGGVASPLAVLVDLAYFRVLLQIGAEIDEPALTAYRTALKQITDPKGQAHAVRSKVKTRKNPYR